MILVAMTSAIACGSDSTQHIVVPVPVSAVAIAAPTLDFQEADVATFVATPKDANGVALPDRAVAWSTNQPTVATVSSTGVVTALAAGTAPITATSEGKSGSVTITVSLAPVNTVAITPSVLRLVVGAQGTLVATLQDAKGRTLAGRPISWVSSDSRVATVSALGVVGAIGVGQATIVVTSEGKSAAIVVIVTPAPVASVTLTVTTFALVLGDTVTAVAEARDASGRVLTGRTVTWTSSDAAVATVNGFGVIVAVGSGTATIQAASEGISGAAIATVVAPLQRTFANVCVDPRFQLATLDGVCGTVTFQTLNRPSGGTDVTIWLRSEEGYPLGWGDFGVNSAVDGVIFDAPNLGSVIGAVSARTEGQVRMIGTGTLTGAYVVEPFVFGWILSNIHNGVMNVASVGCRPATVISQYTAPYALVQHCASQGLDGQLRVDFKMSGVWTVNQLSALQLRLNWEIISTGAGVGGGCNIWLFTTPAPAGNGWCRIGPW